MESRAPEHDATLAAVALERARMFAPFVLAGIVVSLAASGPMGIPLPVSVYVWNVFAIAAMALMTLALRMQRVPLRWAHHAFGLVWLLPVTNTLITQIITNNLALSYVLTVELIAAAGLVRASWMLIAFVVIDGVWFANAIVGGHDDIGLYTGLIFMSETLAYLFQRIYSSQILRAETHRQEQQAAATKLAAQLAELRRSEEERSQLHQQLVHAQRMEAVGTLSAGLAHDMNNILGSIMSFAELARADLDTPGGDPREELELIVAQAARGAELTRALLAFSRRGQYRMQPLVLGDVMREVGAILGRTLPKSIALQFDLPDEPIYVAGDPTQLVQVLVNLAVNASDAMSGDGALVISAHETSGWTHIDVTDTGSGMDEETLGRVFEPFFTTKERGKGTGLGLSTVWGIVSGHDGTIDVRSTIGVGTTFTLHLPVTSERPLPVATRRSAPDASKGPRAKILVVDDEPHVRRGTRRILERKGWETLEAANGAEALQVFAEHADEIGLVVLDMMMPVMGGRECFEQLRRRTDVPVLVTTGHTSEDAAQQLISQGAAFLEKPFPAADLVREAARLLRVVS